jgi:hypothetical protein
MSLKKWFEKFDRVVRNAFGDDQFPNSWESRENKRFKSKLDEIEKQFKELEIKLKNGTGN